MGASGARALLASAPDAGRDEDPNPAAERAIEAVLEDFETAGLDARRLAMLRYTDKLTVSPASVRREDVEALRAVGFGDADVLAIAEVAAYYAYANRIVDGLGVELEEG